MRNTILILAALLVSSAASAQRARAPATVAEANSSFLIKMSNSISTTASKVGDPVTGEVIDPVPLRGAKVFGTVDRADHAILGFSLNRVTLGAQIWEVQSRMVSLTSSAGNEGQDDLGNRVRIEGAGIIAYGTATAVDEGAEVRLTVWKK